MINTVKFDDITFVIQGPINPEVTKRSALKLRDLFPGSQIIISTWEGECVDNISADEVIFNKDPGPTVFVYSKKDVPIYVNINRQMTSTYAGLKRVKTKYAAKLRADNVLHSTNILSLFTQYSQRREEHSFLNNRLVCSNFFAKEFEKGLSVPYFFSDFFQFGETKDLLTVWRGKHYPDYQYRQRLSGKKQHACYPNDSVNVEQKIWSDFANQFIDTQLRDEHGTRLDIENSYNIMLNNLIIVDGEELGLEVPKRLKQGNGYPYDFYTYFRWQWLYEKEFGVKLDIPIQFKLHWIQARVIKWLKKGLRLRLRKWLKGVKHSR